MWLRGGTVCSTGSKKHVRAKPGGAALTDILSYSSISSFPWTWEPIWILGILTYSMSLNRHKWCPGRTKTVLLNTVWYHLLIKPMSCPEYLAQGFIFALRTTYTATCWRSASTVVTSLMHMSLTQNITLVVSNQINCSRLTELSLSRAQFDTWVIKVLA